MLKKIELVIIFCLVMPLTYYMYAKFKVLFWEEAYFISDKAQVLFLVLIIKRLIGLIKDENGEYHIKRVRYGLTLVTYLYVSRLAWEFLYSYNEDFANQPIVIFIMFSITVVLICLHILRQVKGWKS